MNIMDYFGGKTKSEIVAIPKTIISKSRKMIQEQPEYAAAVGVIVGVVLVFYFQTIFSLLILLTCIWAVMYFMAKDDVV